MIGFFVKMPAGEKERGLYRHSAYDIIGVKVVELGSGRSEKLVRLKNMGDKGWEGDWSIMD